MRPSYTLFSVIGLVILVGCAAPRVQQQVTVPAREDGMADARRMAVLPFDGDAHRRFTNRLEAYLANVEVEGERYFTLIERADIHRILDEQDMTAGGGRFDPAHAAELGRLSGADTIIWGSVRLPRIEYDRYSREETRCVARNRDGDCLEYAEVPVPCQRQIADFEFTLKAVGVQTGELRFTKSYPGRAGEERCGLESHAPPAPSADLKRAAIDDALGTMREDIAPYVVRLEIELMADDDSGIDRHAKAKALLEDALEAAGGGDLVAACRRFGRLDRLHPRSAAVQYNLGVCAELEHDLDAAAVRYARAEALAGEGVALIDAALQRIDTKRHDAERLEGQMR